MTSELLLDKVLQAKSTNWPLLPDLQFYPDLRLPYTKLGHRQG